MTKPFAFLQGLPHAGLAIWGTEWPICPHCGAKVELEPNDLTSVYAEGEHEATCPKCNLDFEIRTRVKHTFSTDRQSGLVR